MLILNQLTPYHWAIAGAGIGALTLLLLAGGKKRLGVSTGFENVCSLVVSAPYFQREAIRGTNSWRLSILLGLFLGGVLSAVLHDGSWTTTWDLGVFDALIGWGPIGKTLWMFAGGVLIGFGTRLAGGCTSGHGICGIARVSKRSFAATAVFMATAIVTVFLVRHTLGGSL